MGLLRAPLRWNVVGFRLVGFPSSCGEYELAVAALM
jgi:hypothetical protein